MSAGERQKIFLSENVPIVESGTEDWGKCETDSERPDLWVLWRRDGHSTRERMWIYRNTQEGI